MRQLGEDMNQFAMGQVFCWSARVMCLGISPLPIPRVPDRIRQFAKGAREIFANPRWLC